MTRSNSRIWNSNADEVDELRQSGFWSDGWARRNRNRVVDLWVAWDLHAATQAIHLGRYRDIPELRQAIVDLRQAAQRVADLMRRDVAARKEENR